MDKSKLFDIAFRNDPRGVIEHLAADACVQTENPSDGMWLNGAMSMMSGTADVICTLDNLATVLGVNRSQLLALCRVDGELADTPASLEGVVGLFADYGRFCRFAEELSILSRELNSPRFVDEMKGHGIRAYRSGMTFGQSGRMQDLLQKVLSPEFGQAIETVEQYRLLARETYSLFVQAAMSFLRVQEDTREAA